MAGIFSMTTATTAAATRRVPDGYGGGGEPVETPTPSQAQLFNDGLEQHYTRPVPEPIIEATGQTTWPCVRAWINDQMAAQGLNPHTFTGSVTVTKNTDTGESSVVVDFVDTPYTKTPAPAETRPAPTTLESPTPDATP